MRKLVKISLFVIFLVFLYSILWYIGAINLCSQINKYAKKDIAGRVMGADTVFSFSEVAPYGFPFKVGCKIIGLNEDTDSYAISHNGVVVFGYDLLKKGLFFSNNGSSTAKVKPQVSGFGVEVFSNNSYFFKMPISKKLLKAIDKKASTLELLNFIKDIEINAKNIQAHDLIDNSLIFDHESTRAKLSWDRNYYYRSLEDLTNHIPPKYNLDVDVTIKNVVNNKKIIAPFSPVYFFLPNEKFKISIIAELSTKAQKADFIDIAQNFSIHFQKFDYSNSSVKSNFKGLVSLETLNAQENAVFNFTLAANFTLPELLKMYWERISPHFASDFNDDQATILQEQKDLLAKLQDSQYELNIEADGDYAFGKKLKNLHLESFKFILNDSGFNLHGYSSFSSPADWYADGNVILFDYPNMVVNFIGILNKHRKNRPLFDKISQSDIEHLLRQISNHPESISRDLAIDFQLSHNVNSSRIGKLPLGLFLENYNKILNPK
jgi:hypothetical protein